LQIRSSRAGKFFYCLVSMNTRYLYLLFVYIAVSLTACASHNPNASLVGQHIESVIKTLGKPDREFAFKANKVLHFPRGPSGSHTFFVYLDKDSRVVSWEQVLTEERFDQIHPGMTQEQVVDLIGASSITHGLARGRGYVWHYRYFNYQCKSFIIEFTPDAIVRSADYRTRSGRRCKYVGMG
jgi:hypothetical protein